MREILNIAKAELKSIFYSPIGWVILIIFAFLKGAAFVGQYDTMLYWMTVKAPITSATFTTFGSLYGVFAMVTNDLFMFVPLLTMGVISREFSSGSIKLLYSSPVTNAQIVLGKYLALMGYGLALTGILLLYSVFGLLTIHHFDWVFILAGLLGIFLLYCAYAAIGLFMSSLTTYNIVAALITFFVFALLNWIKGWGQEVPFVRDITYWFGIDGRAQTFIEGMIKSEDVIFFLVVIGMFLCFTIIKLQSGRQKRSFFVTAGKYLGVVGAVCIVGYIATRPSNKVYFDATKTKQNTLTPVGQKIMRNLTGGFTIHSYVNVLDDHGQNALPASYKDDVARFEQYIRYKPETKMVYHYYYHHVYNEDLDRRYSTLNDEQRVDTLRKLFGWTFDIKPYSEISKEVDLSGENFRFVRLLERDNGQRTFLHSFDDQRFDLSDEAEITAVIKRLETKMPLIGIVTGHGERDPSSLRDNGLHFLTTENNYSGSMINQGFDVTNISMNKPVADSISILVIADPKTPFTSAELQNLNAYTERGGSLLIAGEPGSSNVINDLLKPFGVSMEPGILVKADSVFQPDVIRLKPTKAASDLSYFIEKMVPREQLLVMPGVAGLTWNADNGFETNVLFRTDSTTTWNEAQINNIANDTLGSRRGGERKSYATVLSLTRNKNGKTQRVFVTGDADWLSNGELRTPKIPYTEGNNEVLREAYRWLSNGTLPIDVRRPDAPDSSLRITPSWGSFIYWTFRWGLPVALLAASLIIWVRRSSR